MLQKRERRTTLNLIFIAVLGVLINALASNLVSPKVQKAEAQSGIQVRTNQWLRVDRIDGNVTYKNLYTYAKRPAKIGDRLQVVSDEISTGANSSALLTVDTAIGSIFLSENTTIKINSFGIAADNGRVTNLYVPRGKARLQIRKFTNRGSQLNIKTPAGVGGVRGTQFIVIAKPNGDMQLTTLQGSVATTAQNQTQMVNGGFQNLTVVGQPPSPPIPVSNDAGLKYVVNKLASGAGRSVVLEGYTHPFNTVKLDGVEQSLDRNGKFSLKFAAPSNLKVNVTVETPQGKVQVYEIPIL